MIVYLAGNFTVMSNQSREEEFRESVAEVSPKPYHRLLSFYYVNEWLKKGGPKGVLKTLVEETENDDILRSRPRHRQVVGIEEGIQGEEDTGAVLILRPFFSCDI